ncbi:hypothetical protein YOLOSWAG_208 [Erwinia phage vB_EamM_Yoloswag]|uniref:Uncharacterized protein n=1 Tax=Erwinia phage vB_EamM_Yoloswag TaxID=1958956 RepID=A0A1S6L3D7_9CAUD|nr:hypothetical protein HOR66_gp208 [Erwinia phage vB_EamM_Yoloswag]AQT28686.1 hypothetical protein YOLOSWAG_208 [Erwinia phage vB_EamM_Yoloswag]
MSVKKSELTATGRRRTQPQLQNIRPMLLPHQVEAYEQIKKSLSQNRLLVSVNNSYTVVI